MQFPLAVSARRPLQPFAQLLIWGVGGLLIALLGGPAPALAQGFGFYEQGTCVMGQAGAAVADPCDDGSAIFFNPAGILGEQELTVSGGVTALFADGSFTDDRTRTPTDLVNDAIPVPHVYLRYGLNDRLAVGVGAYVPYGLATEWPIDFSGRFIGYDNRLQSIYVQPTAAARITDRLTVGAGLTVVIGSVELNQRLDLSEQPVPFDLPSSVVPDSISRPLIFGQLGIPPRTDFASATLDADGAIAFGGHFGLQFRLTDWLALGGRYMMPVTLNYDGTATFRQVATGLRIPPGLDDLGLTGLPSTSLDDLLRPQFQAQANGLLVTQDVETEITMPAQIAVGVQLKPTPAIAVYTDYQWVNWSSFDRVPLDFEKDPLDSRRIEDFTDTHALRFGLSVAVTQALSVRGGYIRHGPAAPDKTVTPLLPDGTRNEITTGISLRVLDPVELSVAYQYLQQNDRRGRVREAPGNQPPSEALNSGIYEFGAHLAAASLTLHL